MRRSRLALALASVLAAGLVAVVLDGCKQGVGERCQTGDDCQDGLSCNAGTGLCQGRATMDAPPIVVDGRDGGVSDAPVTVDAAPDAGPDAAHDL